VGFHELEAAWAEYAPKVEEEYARWDTERVETAPLYLVALESFRAGESQMAEFRGAVDRISREHPVFGFNGGSQRFLNQLSNGTDPETFEDELRAVLVAPADEAEARERLERFTAAVVAAGAYADSVGARRPDVGRVNAFVSMFWEFHDREKWPALHPNSRNLLAQQGLLDPDLPQPELYLAYRERMQELKRRLGTGTWNVEHLLWDLGNGGSDGAEEPPPPPPSPAGDLYAAYREQGLHFPDDLVTSLVLSLATKRFVILSGISGTGKTQIALGLAKYLQEQAVPAAMDSDPPQTTPHDVFIRLTAAGIKHGIAPVSEEGRGVLEGAIGFPDRGKTAVHAVRMPDGSHEELRISNFNFAEPARTLYRLRFRKGLPAWVKDNAKPGEFLRLNLRPSGEPKIDLSVVSGVQVAAEVPDERLAFIPVRSDWTDPRNLVGFFNPILEKYVGTELIELLVRAGGDPGNPYVVILDEMNLARVEYYFSDFLSLLESGTPMKLMDPGEALQNASTESVESEEEELPEKIEIPPNVSFIGTVNVDETTHPFSPKVLDRANVIEFSAVDVGRALGEPPAATAGGLRLAAGSEIANWLSADAAGSAAVKAQALAEGDYTAALKTVHAILSRHELQFGYRVIDEVSTFVGHVLDKAEGDPATNLRLAFDLQLKQKVIPKLSGGRELEQPLAELLAFCADGKEHPVIDPGATAGEATEAAARYPQSARKLRRMLRRLRDTGFIGALE
jgi:5-methylcytosine-specific restriction enzyme B